METNETSGWTVIEFKKHSTNSIVREHHLQARNGTFVPSNAKKAEGKNKQNVSNKQTNKQKVKQTHKRKQSHKKETNNNNDLLRLCMFILDLGLI